MTVYEKRLRGNIVKNRLLDRELDFLPKTIDRDDVREAARTHGPQRRRSAPARLLLALIDFVARYGAPFLGMIAGAEYAAIKAFYPLMGEEKQYGDSLRLFLGDNIGQKMEDMNKAFEFAGAVVTATPKIIYAAIWGALFGIIAYIILKRLLILMVLLRRRLVLNRKVCELLRH